LQRKKVKELSKEKELRGGEEDEKERKRKEKQQKKKEKRKEKAAKVLSFVPQRAARLSLLWMTDVLTAERQKQKKEEENVRKAQRLAARQFKKSERQAERRST
jgi:hypothetical protein